MSWPTPQDYNEAIQNPHLNFADEELRTGVVEVNALGLPQPSTGSFASAYRMKCQSRDVAVRCFLQSVSDRQQRYKALSESLDSVSHDVLVNFEYLESGIKVKGEWHPIVKMDWIDGETLDTFVRRNQANKDILLEIADKFAVLCRQLRTAGIAHGDLQHGNIIIRDGALRLVDYDGSFVPDLEPLDSNELGHPNYQHPGRGQTLFCPEMDNFSSWVIHESLIAIAHEPELIAKVRGCEECLVLRHIDFAQPNRSAAFHSMEASENERVKLAGRNIRSLCVLAPDAIPPLDTESSLPEPAALTGEPVIDFYSAHFDESDTSVGHVSRAGWPSVNQFMQAVKNAFHSFSDDELKHSRAVGRGNSIWKVMGRESVVFLVQSAKTRYAVKCFLGEDSTRAERYLQIESYMKSKMPWRLRKYFVPFEYISDGIKVGDRWYPVLRMEWLPAYRLDEYIATTPHSKHLALAFLNHWREMMHDLEKAGVAHGNLEPANILVHDGRFKLVDYDTMYVPSMEGRTYEPTSFSNVDLAHPTLPKSVGPNSDNFAAWLIDTALLAWFADPPIWKIVGNPPGRLLFQSSDLLKPAESKLFPLLFHNLNEGLHVRAKLIYRFLYTPPDEIPPLRSLATALLPAEQTREYRLARREQSSRAATIVFCVIAIMVLVALPHGGFISILPTIALIVTIRQIIRDRQKDSERRE